MHKVDSIQHVGFHLNGISAIGSFGFFFFLHTFFGLDLSCKLQNFVCFVEIGFPV